MRMNGKLDRSQRRRCKGFSTLELLMVMFVSLVIAAMAIPGFNDVQRTLRISGDLRSRSAFPEYAVEWHTTGTDSLPHARNRAWHSLRYSLHHVQFARHTDPPAHRSAVR